MIKLNINSVLVRSFTNFASKWLVLFIDVVLVFVCYYMALIVRFNFTAEWDYLYDFFDNIGVILGVYLFGFFIFKSHVGVIRHTSMTDALRLLGSTTFSLVVISVLSYCLKKDFQLPISIGVIHYLLVNFVLLFLRALFKLLYITLTRDINGKQKKKILIFGAGLAGVTTRNAINSSSMGADSVLAFFDDNTSKIGTTVEGVKVYSFDKSITQLLEKNEVDCLVFATQNIPIRRKREVVDRCLELGVEVKMIPPVEDWVGGKLNTKQIKKVRMSDLLGRDSIQLNAENVLREIKDKVVLVTGAAGSIGGEISTQLLDYSPKKLILLDQAETPLYELEYTIAGVLKKKNIGIDCEFVIADVADKQIINATFSRYKPDLVFHAAAYKHVPLMERNPCQSVNTNVLGTKNCADAALMYGVQKFVMVSTDKAVNPTNVMGATKRVAEKYVTTLNKKGITKFVTTRFGNVLGSNGSVIPLFRKQIEAGGPVLVTHPDITRYFMTIPEACQLVLEAGAMGEGGEIFVFDMGESVKIYDVAKKMIKLAGLKLGEDIEVKFVGLRPGEKLYEELLATKENCIDTHHPKIMKAKIEPEDEGFLNGYLSELLLLVNETNSNFSLVSTLKRIVPEYVSNNSEFEVLDKEEENVETKQTNWADDEDFSEDDMQGMKDED